MGQSDIGEIKFFLIMKKKPYVIINWKITSPTGMYRVSSKVVECMTGNKNFATPAVPMPEFTEASDRLNTAIDNRKNGPAARTELKQAADDMDTKLRTQADYVTQTANGDIKVIESSGFEVNKGSDSKSVVPDTPIIKSLKSSKGIVNLSAIKPKGAASLCWLLFIDIDPVPVTVTSNTIELPSGIRVIIIPAGKAKETYGGLPIGTKVTVQVLAQNAAGKSALTAPDYVLVNK